MSYLTYEEFCDLIDSHISVGKDFWVELLEKIIDYPERYFGLFRLSGLKSKIIQNVTQSREIKFGDFVENLVTKYIERIGYTNIDKNILNSLGKDLMVDQLFKDNDTVYVVEMKIRDDHDSTKKRGQFENFIKKINALRDLYPSNKIVGIMRFVDDHLIKNKKYYNEEMKKIVSPNVELMLFYGDELFKYLEGSEYAWSEMVSMIERYKEEHNDDFIINLPDFGNDKIIFDALLELDRTRLEKLCNDERYEIIREELFGTGDNLAKVKAIRGI